MRAFLLLVVAVSFLYAQELKVVFSRTTPPFVFTDDSGIVVDIVKESLKCKNHNVEPIFLNISRGAEMFKSGLVDANSLVQESVDEKAFYSDFFVQYANVIFALKKSHLKLENLEDVKKYSALAFQGADEYLGKEFTPIAKSSTKYKEIADQKQQVHMLFEGRTQMAIMDENIFKYYRNLLIKEGKISAEVEVDRLYFFEPTKYQVAFKDKNIRDDFDFGLKEIKKNGTYEKIFEKYSKYTAK